MSNTLRRRTNYPVLGCEKLDGLNLKNGWSAGEIGVLASPSSTIVAYRSEMCFVHHLFARKSAVPTRRIVGELVPRRGAIVTYPSGAASAQMPYTRRSYATSHI